MAVEREISGRTDLTIEEAVKEYIELEKYLNSENWSYYPVVDNVERRKAALRKIVMNITINTIAERVTDDEMAK